MIIYCDATQVQMGFGCSILMNVQGYVLHFEVRLWGLVG